MVPGLLAAPTQAEKRQGGFLTCVADFTDYPLCIANMYCKDTPDSDYSSEREYRFPWSENLLGDKCSHCQCS